VHVCLSRGVLTRRSGRRRVVSSTGRDSPFSPFSPSPNPRGIRRKGRSSTALGRRVDDVERVGRRRRRSRVGEGAVSERERERGGARGVRRSVGSSGGAREGRARAGGFDSFVRWREVDAWEGKGTTRRDDEEGRERREGGVREAVRARGGR